jgi:hypothetical protein
MFSKPYKNKKKRKSMDKLEQLQYQAQQNWATLWDKANPSNFMKACNDSRARQEEAKYLAQQKEKLKEKLKEKTLPVLK